MLLYCSRCGHIILDDKSITVKEFMALGNDIKAKLTEHTCTWKRGEHLPDIGC